MQDVQNMNIGMISIYPPPQTKHAKLGGVGSYTKNLVEAIKGNTTKIFIFSNKNSDTPLTSQDDNIVVNYCWDMGSIKYPIQIIRNIFFNKREHIDLFHIQYEVFLYGGALSIVTFPLLLMFLKLCRIPILVTIHQVVPITKLDEKFLAMLGVSGSTGLLKLGLLVLLKFIVFLSDGVIVHESLFKKVLIDDYKCNQSSKIHVVHHGVEEHVISIDKNKAKAFLNIQKKNVILFFGYISRYKGLEVLIDSFKYLDADDYVLIIAGGAHPRLKKDIAYEDYNTSLKKRASESQREIIFTGFVPEDKISYYFSSADIVIFPYTVIMSSSGPMALAIAYEIPFLASESFKEVLDKELIFEIDPEELAKKISSFFHLSSRSIDVKSYVKELKNLRLWRWTGEKHIKIYKHLLTK